MKKGEVRKKGRKMTVVIVIAAVLAAAVLVSVLKWKTGTSTGVDVNVAQARSLIEQGTIVIDVRTKGEFSTGHIEGARSIPLDELPGRVGELDSEKPYLVVCLSGSRSAQAVNFLKSKGFQKIYNLKGGMLAWDRN